jgi:hypothetical protein
LANRAIAVIAANPNPKSGQEMSGDVPGGLRVVIRWGPALDSGDVRSKAYTNADFQRELDRKMKAVGLAGRASAEQREVEQTARVIREQMEGFRKRLNEIGQLGDQDIKALIEALKAKGLGDAQAADSANFIVDLYRNRMSDRAVVVEPPEPTKDAARSGITFRDIAEWQREVIAQGVPEPVAFDAVQRYAANCARTGEATSRPIRAILKIVDDMKVASEVGQKKGGGGSDGK